MIAIKNETNQSPRIKLFFYLYFLYFLLAPMEDILTGPIGTVGKLIAILIVLVGLIECHGEIEFELSITNVCMIILMLVSLFSIFWSTDHDKTIERIPAYLLLPSICLFTSLLDFSEGEFDWIITASILGGLITAIVIMYNGVDYTVYGRRSLSEGNDPNNMSAHLLLPTALAWGRLMQKPGWFKLPYGAVFAFLSFSMLTTGSRGGFIALIVMVLSYLLLAGALKNPSMILLTIMMAAVLMHFFPRLLPESLRIRMFMIDNYTGDGAGRTAIWNTTIHKILPNIGLIGFGAGIAPVKMQEIIGEYAGIHNTYLTMLVEYGVLGLPFFLMMIISFTVKTVRTKCFVGTAALIGMCVVIFFLDSFPKKFFWNVIMFLIIQEKSTIKTSYATTSANTLFRSKYIKSFNDNSTYGTRVVSMNTSGELH